MATTKRSEHASFESIFHFGDTLNPFVISASRCIFIPDGHYLPDSYFRAFRAAVEDAGDEFCFARFVSAGRSDVSRAPLSDHSTFLDALVEQSAGEIDFHEYVMVGCGNSWGFWADGNNAGLLAGADTFIDKFVAAFGGTERLLADRRRYVALVGPTFRDEFLRVVDVCWPPSE
ncbi:MAG: hypothetical protein ABL985_17280 [Casimicrobium sp.]